MGITSRILAFSVCLLGLVCFGCGKPFYKSLNSTDYEKPHDTVLVVVNCQDMEYYWEVTENYSTYQAPVTRERIPNWGLVWQLPQKKQLDLLEPYFDETINPCRVIQEVYQRTLADGLAGEQFITVQPVNDRGVNCDVPPISRGEDVSPYDVSLPANVDPDWIFIVSVLQVGLMHTDISAGGLGDALVTAISKKRWVSWFSGVAMLVETDSDLRFIRRLLRDTQERGRSVDSVIRQYQETVRPMHLEFVEPSRRHADVIVPFGRENRVAISMLVARLRAQVLEESD